MQYLVSLRQNSKLSDALVRISVVLFLLFSFSRLSWGLFIPPIGWGIDLSVACLLLGVVVLLEPKRYLKFDINLLMFLLMLVVMVVNNSYDISERGFLKTAFPYICMFLMYSVYARNGRWQRTAVIAMIASGLFYAFFTLLCAADNDLYYSTILPVMAQYGTSYTPHPSAGFTAHYSTNGIYLSIGFMATAATALFACDNRVTFKNLHRWAFLAIITISLLISGKRGILLCLIFAMLVTYYNYTVHNRRGRLLKIVLLGLALAAGVLLLSLFIPSVLYTFQRFVTEFNKGDISNGRFELWAHAWDAFKSAPWIGHGWRWFMYNNTVMYNADAHNCFLQLLTENGIIGALPFFAFFTIAFVRAFKLSVAARNGQIQLDSREVSHIYLALLVQAFMLPFMFEGTALYMPECMFPYFMSCAIVEYHRTYGAHIPKEEACHEGT